MCASPLSFLRAGPPPPKVALLPDALFFTRAVPISPGATAAEATAQIELSLEAISPFPLAQLYYGWFWEPGAGDAFVFASYRRRFTAEQTAAWVGSELVLPAFAALLGGPVKPATTVLLASPEGLTAVHWATSAVPAKVLCHPFEPEATDEARARVRDELLQAIGGSGAVIDLTVPPAAQSSGNDGEIVFRSGDFISRLPAPAALDVRDKGELAALRRARARDVLFWRVALGCAAALLLLACGELALIGGRAWNKVRVAKQKAQQPLVEKITTAQALANRIDELATKRLLPLEMLTILVGDDGSRKPADITFTRVQTSPTGGLYTLLVEGNTKNAGQVPLYQSELSKLPACEKVEVQRLESRGGVTTFTLVVTFKADALKPSES